jgi:xanthine dehydrogenase accessory factor
MPNSDREVYQAILESQAKGKGGTLATVIKASGSVPRHEGAKMLVRADGSIVGTIGGGEMESLVVKEALAALEEGQPRKLDYAMTDPQRGDPGVCGGQLEVYVEPILPQPTIIVIGAGHVGKAVAELAHWMGFNVVVSDDRDNFAAEANIPDADHYHVGEAAELLDEVKIHAQTYVVLTTRNLGVDVKVLPALLESEAAYIGVIGSRRRWETARKKLKKLGLAENDLDRVVSPMGLELNAETPEEIAVSILAEIVMLRRGGVGGRMVDQKGNR